MARLSLLTALLVAVGSASAADTSKPHPHTGKLTPFKLGKPSVNLKASDQSKINAGEMWKTQTMAADGLSGCSTAVQSVAAPPKVIWEQLLDFKTYTKKVEKLPECKVYADIPRGVGGNRQIKVMMKINAAPGFNYVSYYDHIYSPKDKSLIWTLDYTRDSDFDDVTGHWYVTEHPTQKDCSYVYYSADLKLKQWVPKFVLNILNDVALKKAVEWVKRESEEEWKRNPTSGAKGALGFPKVPSFSGFGKPPPPPVVIAPPPRKKLPAQKVAAIAGSAGAFTAAAVAVGIKIAEWGDDDE